MPSFIPNKGVNDLTTLHPKEAAEADVFFNASLKVQNMVQKNLRQAWSQLKKRVIAIVLLVYGDFDY